MEAVRVASLADHARAVSKSEGNTAATCNTECHNVPAIQEEGLPEAYSRPSRVFCLSKPKLPDRPAIREKDLGYLADLDLATPWKRCAR